MKHVFSFAHPFFFSLFLLLPFVLARYLRGKNNAPLSFSSIKSLESLVPSWRERLKHLPAFLRLMALVFFILALARPQWGNKTTEVLSEGIDILLSVDTSGSMKALDFHLNGAEVNRLEVIKKVVDDFVAKRPYDRIGMVVFGETAFTQCPLTLDKDTLRTFLNWVHIGMAGDGTAVGNGLAMSVKRLKDQKTKSKIIILLTDGRNNAGEISPMMAAQIAKDFHIKVYTIGVGTRGPVPYPQETPFGVRRAYAELDLDEDTLKQIAEATGGQYFRATETEELEKIYSTIDQLEKTEIKVKEYHEEDELYAWFLVVGFFFLLMEIILSQTVFVRLP